MHALHEQYRPRTWSDVAGQEAALQQIRRTLKRGWGGRAWWITGASGTGKSTLARLIAAEGADPFNTHELDAGHLTPSKLQDLKNEMRYTAIGEKNGRAYIVNEAHGLRRDTMRDLLVLLEALPRFVVWIFTTTKDGQQALFDDCDDTAPLVSRCTELELVTDERTLKAFARRAKQVAVAEGLDGLPEAFYDGCIRKCRGNLRQLLQRIETGKFLDDARECVEKELAMLQGTKGDNAAARRADLHAVLEMLQRSV